jgi:MFS family permease
VSGFSRSRIARSRLLRPIVELRRDYPRVVLVLATGDLVASFGFSLFFPFLTIYLVQTLGASAAEAGLVIAAYSLCSIVSGVVGGWLADRVGRRPVLIGSISCTTLLVLAMAFAAEAWQVGVVMLLLGCTDPAFVPAARAAVADTVDEARRPRAFGLLGVANAIGWIAGPVIGAGLSVLGYPVLFAISGLLIALYVVIAVRWLPETRPVAQPVGGAGSLPPVGGAGSLPPVSAGVVTASAALQPAAVGRTRSASGTRRRSRRRVFIAFLPLLAVTHATTFLWVTTLPIYAAGPLGLPTPTWGLLFGLNGLLIVLFQMRVSARIEHRSKPRVMALSLVLYMLGIAVVIPLTPATAVVGLALTITLVTLGEMLLMPTEPAFVSDLSPLSRRGAYQGVALAASGLGSGLGPPIAGQVLDAADGGLLWLGCAAIIGATAVGLRMLAHWTDRLDGHDVQRDTGAATA